MNKKIITGQLIRFASVGVCSTLISYGIYYLLLIILDKYFSSTMSANISYAIGYIVGFFFNYSMTTLFTFKTKANPKNAIGFLGANIINYILQAVLLNIYLSLEIERKIAFFLVVVVAVPINFCMQKIVFWWADKKSNH